MTYIIGVDAGGTKTTAVSYQLNGDAVNKAISGFGNVIIHYHDALAHLTEAINKCMKKHPNEQCAMIVAGVAGIDSCTYRTQYIHSLKAAFTPIPIHIINDIELAHAAFLKGDDGIITIAGTGSIALGVYDNQTIQTGGWGHLIADEGSGFWIAMELLKRAAKELDLSDKLPPDIYNCLKPNQLLTKSAIKTLVYQHNKDDIASLAKDICIAADNGNNVCSIILQNAGILLGNLAASLYRRISPSVPLPVFGTGGILTNIPKVQQSFNKTIYTKLAGTTPTIICGPATIGGYYIARKLLNCHMR